MMVCVMCGLDALQIRDFLQQVNEEGLPDDDRVAIMNAVNPLYIPRNYLMHKVIEAAEAGDCEPLHTLYEVLKRPFVEQVGMQHFSQPAPEWATKLAGVAVLS